MERVLITGASGFIGGRAANALSQKGYKVVTCGRATARPKNLFAPGIEYFPVNFLDAEKLQKLLTGVDCVIHCAAKSGIWGPYQEYFDSNVGLTRALLLASMQAKVRRFINMSSPAIYFDFKNQLGLTEDYMPAGFINGFAETKYLAEKEVFEANSPAFETVSFRPWGVLGAGDTQWMPRLISYRQSNKLRQIGDGSNIVNFTSVTNLIHAFDLAIKAPKAAMGETYNLTNGVSEYFWDVVERALKAVGLDGQRKKIPLRLAMAMAQVTEKWNHLIRSKKEPILLPISVGTSAYSMTMDISKAMTRLGYEPQTSTEQALQEFAAWYNKGQKWEQK